MAAFSSLTDRLSNAFKHLKSKGKLSDADIDGTIREIRRALLDADVSLDVVRSFTARVRDRALSTEVSEALNPAQQVVRIVNDELTDILGQGVDRPLNFAKNPPTIIMLAGLQGAGKTTLAGKLGYWLKDSGHTPLLVAADLQRPNAVTQLQVVGERAGVPVYAPEKGVQSDGGEAVASPGLTTGDPVKVARDAVALAKQKLYDTVIIDTAGRLGVDEGRDGRAAGADAFCDWCLKAIADTIDLFCEKFLVCFDACATDLMAKTPGFKEYYLDSILSDTAAYAGTELIRRTVGMANVKDVTTIADEAKRAHAEKVNILCAKDYIMNRTTFKTGADFIAAVTRADEAAK